MRLWLIGVVAIGCGGGDKELSPEEEAAAALEGKYAVGVWDDTSAQCTDPSGVATPLGGQQALFVDAVEATLAVHACFVDDVEPCGFSRFDARNWLSDLTLEGTGTDRWSMTHTFTSSLGVTECGTDSETITLELRDEGLLALRWRRSAQVITPEPCETVQTDTPEVDDTTPCVLSHYIEATPDRE
jgi:hypothetical protein